MDKKRGLTVVGTFWFGLALAGGCESTSGGTAKRAQFSPTPTIARNTGSPATPGTQNTTNTATGAGTPTAGVGSNTTATGTPTAAAVVQPTPGIQTTGATVDPYKRDTVSTANMTVPQAPAPVKDTSNFGMPETPAAYKPKPTEMALPTERAVPVTSIPKNWSTEPSSLPPAPVDDGLGKASDIRVTGMPTGTVLPPPPSMSPPKMSSSMTDMPVLKTTPPAPPSAPSAPTPPSEPVAPPPVLLPELVPSK